MLRINLFFSLLAVSGAAAAQQNAPTKISFQLQDNLIHVHAVIEGKDVSAVLDSGSGALLVSKSLASKLGLELAHSSIQAMGGGTADQSISPIKLRTLAFGPFDLKNLSGYAVNLNSISASSGFKVDALLGYPLFEYHAVRVNYAKQYVMIYPKGMVPTCQNPIPIKIINNVPVIIAKVKTKPGSAAKTVHLVVDLGSRHYNYLGGGFLGSDPGRTLYSDGLKEVVGDGIGGHIEGVIYKFAELDVGTQHFQNMTFALTKQIKGFNSKKIEGSLGVPLWEMGVITFDYSNKKLCIDTPHK